MIRTSITGTALLLAVLFLGITSTPQSVDAQVVQLPTIRFFNVRTVVSVPDGGTIKLGGVNRNSRSSTSRGVPGLGGLPVAGRLFRNRAIGGESTAGGSSVSAKIIVMSELEAALMAEVESLRKKAALTDPNGSAEVQHKADFITRNIGRTRKR